MPSNFCFMCMYKMTDISAETWNKTGLSAIKIHKSNNVKKQFDYYFAFLT